MTAQSYCDFCGSAAGPTWEHAVRPFHLAIPAPDGINHRVRRPDLCRRCRVIIGDAMEQAVNECVRKPDTVTP